MHVNVTCCGCKRQLRLPGEVVGGKVACPMCKAVFVARSKGGDRVEAIPVADAPGRPSLDEADLLPLEPIEPNSPSFSLDDPPPVVKDARREPDPEPDIAPLRMIDDDVPRRELDPAPPRSRRRLKVDDANEERPRKSRPEDDAEKPRKRRREGEALASFAIYIHRDPYDKLAGRFEAEADPEGLKIWRGSGRTLEVARGSACEYLGEGRVALLIEGRKVEVTTLHPDGMHDDLAREVLAFVEKQQDTVSMPVRRLGGVVWLALLPLGLPLLSLLLHEPFGVLAWTGIAAGLTGFAALLVTRRSWSAGSRAWGASLVAIAGLLFLASVARFDDSSQAETIPGPWCDLAPVDGGFRAEVPGLPQKAASGLVATPFNLREVYSVNVPAAGSAFVVAYGNTGADKPAEQHLEAIAVDFAQRNDGRVSTRRELAQGGAKGLEFEIDMRENKRLRARAFFHEQRLFALAFVSSKLPTKCAEATQFLDSFALDPATGWPGPPTPGVAVAAPPQVAGGALAPQAVNPFQPAVPFAADLLGPGAKVVAKHERGFVWCGVTSDGKYAIAVSQEGGVIFCDAVAETEIARILVPVNARAVSAALSPDGKLLAVVGSAGTLHLVDVNSRRLVSELAPSDDVAQWAVAFSPDNNHIATAHAKGQVRIHDFTPRKVEKTLSLGDGQILCLAWPKSDLLIAGDSGRAIRFVNPATGQVTANFPAHDPAGGQVGLAMRNLAVARDGRTLVSISNDRSTKLWDIPERQLKFNLAMEEVLLSVAIHPSGKLIFTGGTEGLVRVWDSGGLRRGQFRDGRFGQMELRAEITGLAFPPDGKTIFVAAANRLEAWKLEHRFRFQPDELKPLPSLPPYLNRIEGGQPGFFAAAGPLTSSADGRRVAFVSKDSRARLWNAASFAQLYETPVPAPGPLALSPDGGRLAFANVAEVGLRALESNADLGPFRFATLQGVSSLALSGDGKRLAVGHRASHDAQPAELILWDIATKTPKPLHGHRRAVSGVAFAGDTLASVGPADPFVRLWDATTGREIAPLKGHSDGVVCVTASPDGKLLASGGLDKTIRLWDVAAKRQTLLLSDHSGAVTHLAFAPDGRTLASASADKSIKFWDVGSGKVLHKLVTYQIDITGIGFGPGGKSLFVRTANLLLDRWDLESIEGLKKRPDPAKAHLDKSQTPDAPGVQHAGTIANLTALVVAQEKGCALAFTRDRQVLRYSYPEWKLTHAVWMREAVTGAALDVGTGVLYAAVCEPGKTADVFQLGWLGESGLAVINAKELLDGKNVPTRLMPTATVPLKSRVRDLCLVDGGRSLYYLAERKPLQWWPERIDTAARTVSSTIELPSTTVTRMRATPGGRSLAMLAMRRVGLPVHFVAEIDATTAKIGREVIINATAFDFDANSDGAVVACQNSVQFVNFAQGKVESRPCLFTSFSPLLPANGEKLYLVENQNGARVAVCEKVGGRLDPSKPTEIFENAMTSLGQTTWMTPDARFLVSSTGKLLRLSAGGLTQAESKPEAVVLEEGKLPELPPWVEGHLGRVLAVALSPDGQVVLTAGEDHQLLQRRAGSGEKIDTKGRINRPTLPGAVNALAVSLDGQFAVAGTSSGTAGLFSWPTPTFFAPKRGGRQTGLDTVTFLPDSNHIAAGGAKGLIVWSARPGVVTGDLAISTKATLTGVAANPKTGLVAAGSIDGKVYLFDTKESKEKGTLDGHAEECRCVAFTPDGKLLVSAGVDGIVRAWDFEKGKLAFDLGGQASPVMALAIAPDGNLVVAGGLDGSLRLWSLTTRMPVTTTAARQSQPVHALAFSPDGKTLYATAGTIVRRWNASGLIEPKP